MNVKIGLLNFGFLSLLLTATFVGTTLTAEVAPDNSLAEKVSHSFESAVEAYNEVKQATPVRSYVVPRPAAVDSYQANLRNLYADLERGQSEWRRAAAPEEAAQKVIEASRKFQEACELKVQLEKVLAEIEEAESSTSSLQIQPAQKGLLAQIKEHLFQRGELSTLLNKIVTNPTELKSLKNEFNVAATDKGSYDKKLALSISVTEDFLRTYRTYVVDNHALHSWGERITHSTPEIAQYRQQTLGKIFTHGELGEPTETGLANGPSRDDRNSK